jgi:hypothetical protein
VVVSDTARACMHAAAPAVHDRSTTPRDRVAAVLLHGGVPPIAAIGSVTAGDTCDTIGQVEVHDCSGGARAYAAVRRRCLPSLTDATTTCYY